ENSVRTDSAMAVTNPHDEFRPQAHLARTIVNHYEIVAGAVHLGETQHVLTVAAAVLSRNPHVRTRATTVPKRNNRALLNPKIALYFIRMRKFIWILAICGLAGSASAGNYNALILEQVGKMPTGGKYSVSHFAKIKLQSSAHFESGKFFVIPTKPYVSFCSGATYLVFIKAIEALRDSGQLKLDYATLNELVIRDQRDGEGVWGRWNANGPGTARLFYELGLGHNFTDLAQAQPGDFMKIFWNRNIGRRESGHSVIFLGT